jgi:hypothetical protein
MMFKRMPELKIGIAAGIVLALAIVVSGCGDRAAGDDGVRARNLLTGEIKDFPSTDDIPPDWVTCSTPDCTIPPSVPCEKLSEAVCTLNPNCRLKKLWCEGDGVVAPDGTPGTSDGSEPGGTPGTGDGSDPGTPGTGDGSEPPSPGTTPPSPPAPPKCKYQCIPKLPLLCDELNDEKQCKARSDCEWDMLACPAICQDDGKGGCLPCPAKGFCRAKTPPICQSIADKQQCTARPDCEWEPLACIMIYPPPPGCTDPNAGTCKPKSPVPPPCPTLPAPPPDYCKGGKIIYDKDSNGCVIGYHCEVPQTQTCWDLNKAYINAIGEAKACNPYIASPAPQCTKSVKTALFCPLCDTFINPQNTAAIAKMTAAETKWKSLSCDQMEVACPAMACMAPKSATCLPGGSAPGGGSCVDDQPSAP